MSAQVVPHRHVPWERGDWDGQWVSVDGTEAAEFFENDVSSWLAAYSTDEDSYDGDFAGIVRLTDGRYVSWEGSWGPTGHGFARDAYGGTTDVFFARTMPPLLRTFGEVALFAVMAQVGHLLADHEHAAMRLGGVEAFGTGGGSS